MKYRWKDSTVGKMKTKKDLLVFLFFLKEAQRKERKTNGVLKICKQTSSMAVAESSNEEQ